MVSEDSLESDGKRNLQYKNNRKQDIKGIRLAKYCINLSYLDCFFLFREEPNAQGEGGDHIVDSESEILPVIEHVKQKQDQIHCIVIILHDLSTIILDSYKLKTHIFNKRIY